MKDQTKQIARREDLSEQIAQAGISIQRSKLQAIKLSEKPRIPDMDPVEFKTVGVELLRYIWKDFGIQGTPEKYDEIRFLDFLLAYYRDFSLEEIKLAFEYFITGELEGYVRKELNHYGRWSIQFAADILKGYRSYRGRAISDTRRQLPEPKEIEKTPEEIEADHINYCRFIYNQLEGAISRKEEPLAYFFSSFVHKTLCDVGILEPREVSDKEVDDGFGKFLARQDVDRFQKDRYRNEFQKDGKISGILKNTVINHAIQRDIQNLIKEGDIDGIRDKFIAYASNRNRSREK